MYPSRSQLTYSFRHVDNHTKASPGTSMLVYLVSISGPVSRSVVFSLLLSLDLLHFFGSLSVFLYCRFVSISLHFTHVSYPLSPSLTYYWYLGKMGDVSSSSDKVFGQKMHGILQRQRIDILPEIVCHLQEVRYLNLFE